MDAELPPCMEPDGGDCCQQFHALKIELSRLTAEIGGLRIGAALWEASEAECEKLRAQLAGAYEALLKEADQCQGMESAGLKALRISLESALAGKDMSASLVDALHKEIDRLKITLAGAYEEAAKAMCEDCGAGTPLVDGKYHPWKNPDGRSHGNRPCYAAPIRALAGKHGGG